MDDYLSKPFRQRDLIKLLARWLQPGESPALVAGDVLDRNALAALASVEEGGGPELLEVFINSFLESTPQRMTELERAIEGAVVEDVHMIAHGVKSSSTWVGAVALADLFEELETMARDGSLEGAAELFLRIQKEYSRVETALDNINVSAPIV